MNTNEPYSYPNKTVSVSEALELRPLAASDTMWYDEDPSVLFHRYQTALHGLRRIEATIDDDLDKSMLTNDLINTLSY